jgi:hypothetical protein
MVLPLFFSELMDVTGFKQRAKLKRALREKEARVLSDLWQWQTHSINKKKRLQKKCLIIGQHYFTLAATLGDDTNNFEKALLRLEKWHQSVEHKTDLDKIIIELIGYIQTLKSSRLDKNDQLILFKLGVLYHQLAVIEIASGKTEEYKAEIVSSVLYDCMHPVIDETRLTAYLLKTKGELEGSFLVKLVVSIEKADSYKKERILNGFFSNALTQFVNILFYCSDDPSEAFFKEQDNIALLATLKTKAKSLHDFYLVIMDTLKIFKPALEGIHPIDNLIKQRYPCIKGVDQIEPEKIAQLINLLTSWETPLSKDSQFLDWMTRLEKAYSIPMNLTLWFDLLYEVERYPDWYSQIQLFLKNRPLQSIVDEYQYFNDLSFNEVCCVFKKNKDNNPHYQKISECMALVFQCYQDQIELRGLILKPRLFESLAYDLAFEKKHAEFFERFHLVYDTTMDTNQEKLDALFSDCLEEG